ncbi:hypothetical protein CSKR_108939 [Clonorchis sinensis]|uniref:Uncharacterized protein n=1 Tax=Clonorchis sinensis TaxID=79923 RepID=A0A419PQG8_CLOSI|nr:hypothetical protein CSKR_108939 [Clonorchis sinensis]
MPKKGTLACNHCVRVKFGWKSKNRPGRGMNVIRGQAQINNLLHSFSPNRWTVCIYKQTVQRTCHTGPLFSLFQFMSIRKVRFLEVTTGCPKSAETVNCARC